jgi:2-polyprenyl-3-methyl-5-hydroxy-6-metoxy-1,4-benzoquinol methylase
MIPSRSKTHWDEVYSTGSAADVSWYQDNPALSLALIREVGPEEGGRIIDVGGGASVLVDRLLGLSFEGVAVLDISEDALDRAKTRLARRAEGVEWIVADVTEIQEIGTADVWHDRAVFHFLTDPADRARYRDLAARTVRPGGHLIVATFADDGPSRCSGLDVRRYDARALAAELGEQFTLVKDAAETHRTPWGAPQSFVYGVFRRS